MTIEWNAPGGGLWELESAHLHGGQPRVFQERAPRGFRDGFARAAVRYGLPIDHLDVRFVNDHCYARMVPVGAPEPKPGKASKAPPAFVLKALARLHPELRRRTRAARQAIESKLWLRDLEAWDRGGRAEMLAAGRALQDEDVEHLGDDALVDHIRRAAAHHERGMAKHFELIPVHNVPVGRLLLACRRWGISDAETFAMLQGSSPASVASASALAAIAAECARAGVDPTTVDDVRNASPEAERALDAYLAVHGWRVVTQYSPRGVALIELPDVLVQAIRAAGVDRAAADEPDVAQLRNRVPQVDRAAFDDLLADARACYGNRDENVALTFLWPTGLLRRALLEAGRRLAARGTLPDAPHVFTLGEEEIAAAFAGDPTIPELARRRMAHGIAAEAGGAPRTLGDDEGPPPDPHLFPAAMAELVEAILIEFELEQAMVGAVVDPALWTGEGVGIGDGSYTGRACVATTVEDALMKLEPGDILVTPLTTPAFEAIMPIAGAVVTEAGGLMSHTALVCREYGIPAVVGVAGATAHISDRSTITVDAAMGRVS